MSWLTIAIVVVAALAMFLLVRTYEARLAFFPTRGEDVTPADHSVGFAADTIATDDGEHLRVWHLRREQPLARVVYFHGNGGNLSLWCDVLVQLHRHGFDVVAFDYRGYGLSTGMPSEAGLYRDVKAVLRIVHAGAQPSGVPLIYWGRSLGTTMAAYAASVREPDGIVLESGFPSMRAVVRSNPILWVLSWFSSYEFPTVRWMARIRAPVLVLHGTVDSVIPYHLGRELYSSLPAAKEFVAIDGGDHNDATPPHPGKYWAALTAFARTLAAP